MSKETCLRKKSFATRKYAKQRAKLLGVRAGCKMYIYQCPECKMYHVTHVSPEEQMYIEKGWEVRVKPYKRK